MSPQHATSASEAAGYLAYGQTQPESFIAFPSAFGIVLRKTPNTMTNTYVFRLHEFLTRNAGAWSESDDLFGWTCASRKGDLEWTCRKLEQAGLQRGVDFVQTTWPSGIFPDVSWLQPEPLSGLLGYLC